ncbi:MAG: hypothetical protein WD066_09305 [Planctomycetaceae bacterium]
MKSLLRHALMVLPLAALAPVVAEAQYFPGRHHDPCATCAMPVAQCGCHAPRPVVETRYRQENVVTYRNVAETQYTQQSVVERVPVVKHEQVTVDEGGYQMVWVPKPVTRTVARTECEDRVVQRTVPQTVIRQVPQVTTRLVPEQTVRHVPQTFTTSYAAAPCVDDCVPTTTASMPLNANCAAPREAVTLREPVPAPRAGEVELERPVPYPTPDPTSSRGYDEWSTIPSRTSGRDDRGSNSYDPVPTRNVSNTTTTVPRISARGKFVPAPSAATVWQYRSDTSRN